MFCYYSLMFVLKVLVNLTRFNIDFVEKVMLMGQLVTCMTASCTRCIQVLVDS